MNFRGVELKQLNFLETLNTKRLLSYYRSQRKLLKTFFNNFHYTVEKELELQEHLKQVKTLLDKREHISK